MKFKTYLNEYTTRKISDLIVRKAIPLVPSMMKRLGYYWEDIDVYHVTNSTHLDDMVKNQKKNKQISTFSRGGPELARLPSLPDILLKLNGDEVIKGDSDIWTLVDQENRRWLDIKRDTAGLKLRKFLVSLVQKAFDTAGVQAKIEESPNSDTEAFKVVEGMTGKQKYIFYKTYIDEVERFLDSSGYKYLNKYLDGLQEFQYNEIILNKWQIQELWCIESESPHIVSKCAKLGLTYRGVIPRSKLSTLKI